MSVVLRNAVTVESNSRAIELGIRLKRSRRMKNLMSRNNLMKTEKKRSTILFSLAIIVAIFFSSCSSTYFAMIKSEPKQDDITLTPEMKQFLGKQKNWSVVLRVPNSSDRVTAETASKNNSIYNNIEKNLLKAGFNVRDRGLLESVLRSGQANYAEIGEKIDTDIIIEILDISWDIDNFQHNYTVKKNNKTGNFSGNVLNPKMAKLECKLIIVEKGATGGVFTLYCSTCTDGCDFYYYVDFWHNIYYFGFDNKRAPQFSSLTWYLEVNDVTDYFSNKIIKILQNRY